MNKKGVLPVLPKALFLSTIEKIRQQEARIDEFDKALSKMCDGFPAFDKDNLYLLALRDLLKYTMQDQYDNIGWKRRMPVTLYPGKKPARKSLLI